MRPVSFINIIRCDVFLRTKMSVDKFGRHQSAVTVRRETKRQIRDDIGFKITNDGHIDVENKKIRNLEEPVAANDAVSLAYVQNHCLLIDDKGVDVKRCKLRNVENPVDVNDAVNKFYVDDKCVQYSSGVIDARNQLIINVRDPQQPNDVVNKEYVDSKTIKRESDSWLFGNSWLTQVRSPTFNSDAVNLKYMLENTISLRPGSDIFNAAGKRITDVADGSADSDVVNVRQMHDLKQYTKKEMRTMVSVFKYHVEQLYKLNKSRPRSSEDEWTLDTKEITALIDKCDKDTEVKDWRSVYDG